MCCSVFLGHIGLVDLHDLEFVYKRADFLSFITLCCFWPLPTYSLTVLWDHYYFVQIQSTAALQASLAAFAWK
jgi:hypothetical protein